LISRIKEQIKVYRTREQILEMLFLIKKIRSFFFHKKIFKMLELI